MKSMMKNKYITASAMLLVSSVVVKLISAFYKIPLTAFIGAQGRGYFAVAYNLCLPIHAITMGAFPVALTKLVSAYDAKGEYDKIYSLKYASKKLFFITGLAGTAAMILFAKPYSNLISSSPDSIYTILALSPSVFFSCLCAGRRAYAEGFLDMKLTSFSQLIEVASKMLFGLIFARISMTYLYNEYLNTGYILGVSVINEKQALSQIYPLTSAFSMLGATFGSILSYTFSLIYDYSKYRIYRPKGDEIKSAYNEMLTFSVSLVGATVIQSIAGFVDSSSIQYCLSRCSEEALKMQYTFNYEDIHTYVLGIYASALDFKNLIPSIVMSLGVTAVPAVSSAYENSGRGFSLLVTSIFKYSMIISCFGALVLLLYNHEILDILYSKSNPDICINAPKIMWWFGLTVIPCSVATTVIYSVQALGFAKASIPSFIISSLLRVFLNFILVSNDNINIIGAAISNFFGYFLIVIWNIIIITRKTHVKIEYGKAFLNPMLCAVITYFAVDYLKIKNFFAFGDYIELIISAAICLFSFCVLLFLTKTLSLKENLVRK